MLCRSVARLGVLLALVGVTLALCATRADADGDPASDVLIGADTFYPFTPVQGSVEKAVNEATAALHRHGVPLKVAVIASPNDLGAVTQLYNSPGAYAHFLDVELSYYDPHGPLLVVMPDGFGAEHFPARLEAIVRSLPKPGSRSATTLARAALSAEERLAHAQGFSLAAVAAGAKAGGDSHTGLVILLAAVAVLGSLGLVFTSPTARRRLGLARPAGGSEPARPVDG